MNGRSDTTRAAYGPPFFIAARGASVRIALFTALYLCLFAAFPGGALAETLHAYARTILDGDTIVLDSGTTVRLLGIDAPEIAHKDKPGQYYGREAREALRGLVAGKLLAVEVAGNGRDRYGRVLGVVRADDESVNEMMVARGAAFFYWHEDVPQSLAAALMTAQTRSIRDGAGFWPRIAAMPAAPSPYIGNARSHRFHAPGCPLGAKVSRKNRRTFQAAIDAFEAGFAPARNCTPWPGAE